MSARILILNNGSNGTTHWIEKPVIRVGSDPSSDIVIPNSAIAPHTLTVEFRQTGYRVYNRSSGQVFLGSRILDPGQHASWLDTDLLELSDGVSLALEIDDDPSPASRPVRFSAQRQPSSDTLALNASATTPPGLDREVASPPTADSSNLGSATGNSPALQLLVIGFCLLGSIGLLVRHQLKRSASSESSVGVKVPSFGQMVQQARQPGSDIPPDLVDQLQLAEAALVRGQRSEAHRRYQRLYDRIVRHATDGDRVAASSSTEPSTASSLQQLNLLVRARLATAK